MPSLLPIFPLSTVLYPGLVLPLQIFEERYRLMVHDLAALPVEQRQFGVVAIRSGREVGEEDARTNALHQVGCIARLREINALPEDRFALVATGGPRFRLRRLDRRRRYLRGEAELLDEPSGDGAPALATVVAALFADYRRTLTGDAGDLDLTDDPELVSYVVAAATVLDLKDKQALLEAPDTAQRLAAEITLLRREIGVLNSLPSLPALDLVRTEVSSN